MTRWRAETLRAACFLILAGLICGLTWQQYFTSRLAREIGASVRQGVLHTDTAFPAPVRPPVLIALGERDGLFHDSVIASRVLNGWPISVAEFGDCAFCQPPCVLVPETDFAVPADPVRGLAAGFLRRPEAE